MIQNCRNGFYGIRTYIASKISISFLEYVLCILIVSYFDVLNLHVEHRNNIIILTFMDVNCFICDTFININYPSILICLLPILIGHSLRTNS